MHHSSISHKAYLSGGGGDIWVEVPWHIKSLDEIEIIEPEDNTVIAISDKEWQILKQWLE